MNAIKRSQCPKFLKMCIGWIALVMMSACSPTDSTKSNGSQELDAAQASADSSGLEDAPDSIAVDTTGSVEDGTETTDTHTGLSDSTANQTDAQSLDTQSLDTQGLDTQSLDTQG
ncbi:MAG TPA: hypothetical protein DCQ06_00865, partial [Myxococcales bacterium]|nr:hypothetical protein [Myxococcales bacterium]